MVIYAHEIEPVRKENRSELQDRVEMVQSRNLDAYKIRPAWW